MLFGVYAGAILLCFGLIFNESTRVLLSSWRRKVLDTAMWRRLCWKAPRNQRVCGYAQTPEPPYFAVIFTSERTSTSEGYEATAQQMLQLARRQPGFLGVESARESLGITVSYWASEEAIAAWKANVKHLVAQEKGKRDWYSSYATRICRVERDYTFRKAEDLPDHDEDFKEDLRHSCWALRHCGGRKTLRVAASFGRESGSTTSLQCVAPGA
ncbi:unnamed protein product [Effrenium voratum]|nr:unnamed protein product [Effrenium voratum]